MIFSLLAGARELCFSVVLINNTTSTVLLILQAAHNLYRSACRKQPAKLRGKCCSPSQP